MGLFGDAISNLPVVEAELNYLVPMREKPRNYATEPPPGVPGSNATHEAHRLAICDARPAAPDISLDQQGFALIREASKLRNFHDEDEIRSIYYPEAEALVQDATGADRVFVFDHVVRRHVPGKEDRRGGERQPVWRVHVDYTARSGPQRVRDLLPEDAPTLLRGRVQIVNLWRPIRGPVRDAPLAVCDASSVTPEDLVPSDLIYRERTGETYSVTYNPEHRWFYLADMEPEEAFLLKCFDSRTDGQARFAPHSAFKHPSAPAGAPPRESIELRSLVFHRA